MTMRRRSLKAVLAVGIAAAILGASASGGTARVGTADVSTRQGALSYLRSLGLNPDGFVVQRGARNYAGPRCPGKGWTCTTSTRVLQISTAGTNSATCDESTAGTDLSSPANYRCVIVQRGVGGANVATCRLITDDSAALPTSPEAVSQSCDITQTIDPTGKQGGKNTATVDQQIVQRSARGCGLIGSQQQCATQTAKVTQFSAKA